MDSNAGGGPRLIVLRRSTNSRHRASCRQSRRKIQNRSAAFRRLNRRYNLCCRFVDGVNRVRSPRDDNLPRVRVVDWIWAFHLAVWKPYPKHTTFRPFRNVLVMAPWFLIAFVVTHLPFNASAAAKFSISHRSLLQRPPVLREANFSRTSLSVKPNAEGYPVLLMGPWRDPRLESWIRRSIETRCIRRVCSRL